MNFQWSISRYCENSVKIIIYLQKSTFKFYIFPNFRWHLIFLRVLLLWLLALIALHNRNQALICPFWRWYTYATLWLQFISLNCKQLDWLWSVPDKKRNARHLNKWNSAQLLIDKLYLIDLPFKWSGLNRSNSSGESISSFSIFLISIDLD